MQFVTKLGKVRVMPIRPEKSRIRVPGPAAALSRSNRGRTVHRINRRGFTLIELVLVMSILSTLATIAVPQFTAIRDRGRVTGAIGDLKMLESEILAHFAANGSVLPADLNEIGRAGYLDPWGNPYVYNPFSTSIVYGCATGGTGNGGGGGNGNGGGGNGKCEGPPPANARKDKFLKPVNHDFDLYSFGADGASAAPFTAGESRDDVVRAGSGGFFGLAEQF